MYLLYFIAFVTLHVTMAENLICDLLDQHVLYEDRVKNLTTGIVIKFMRQQIDWTEEVYAMMEQYIDDVSIKCGLLSREKNIIIEKASLMIGRKSVDEARQEIADGINNFTAKFFKAFVPNRHRFPFFSPFIVHASLSLLAPLAPLNSAREMSEILGLPMTNGHYGYTKYKMFFDSLNSISTNISKLRFKYFLSNEIGSSCILTEHARKIFGMEIQNLDFRGSLRDSRINIADWFENVPTIYHGGSPQRPYPINLMHVLNNQTKFVISTMDSFYGTLERKLTTDGNSYIEILNDSGGMTFASIFHGVGDYRHGDISEIDAQFIELPLKTENSALAFSLLVIRPNKDNDNAMVKNNFGSIDLKKILAFPVKRVNISIPEVYYADDLRFTETLLNLSSKPIQLRSEIFDNDVEHDVLIDEIFQYTTLRISYDGAIGPGENLNPLENDDPIVEFKVNSTCTFAIVLKESVPIYVYIGQFP